MSEADDFRFYANEAMRWATDSTTETEKGSLLDLACIWAQAALAADDPHVRPPEYVGP
jgi:hypothetical protein